MRARASSAVPHVPERKWLEGVPESQFREWATMGAGLGCECGDSLKERERCASMVSAMRLRRQLSLPRLICWNRSRALDYRRSACRVPLEWLPAVIVFLRRLLGPIDGLRSCAAADTAIISGVPGQVTTLLRRSNCDLSRCHAPRLTVEMPRCRYD